MLKGTQRAREQLANLETELGHLGDEDRPVFDFDWFTRRLDDMPIDEVRAFLRSVATVTLHRQGKGSRHLRPELVEVVAR